LISSPSSYGLLSSSSISNSTNSSESSISFSDTSLVGEDATKESSLAGEVLGSRVFGAGESSAAAFLGDSLDLRATGCQPIKSSAGLDGASFDSSPVNIDGRTVSSSGEGIGSNPRKPSFSDDSVSGFGCSGFVFSPTVDEGATVGFAGLAFLGSTFFATGFGDFVAFGSLSLFPEIPNMPARKSQWLDFFSTAGDSSWAASSASGWATASASIPASGLLGSLASGAPDSDSVSLSKSSSSIGSTFLDAFPPK
jgi:hypothetical protein